jgi:hypothetical protein
MTELTSNDGQRGERVDGGREGGLGGDVGDDDEASRAVDPPEPLAAGGSAANDLLLANGLDRHLVVGEGRGHLGEDARAIGDVEADVVAGEGLAHVEQRQVGVGALPGPRPPRTRCRATATTSPRTALAVGSPPAPRP